MHQRRQSSQPKRKTSLRTHSSLRQRRKGSVRRTWSNDLPSLASHTVKMVVATIQLSDKTSNFDDETVQTNHHERRQSSVDQDHDDDDGDDLLDIGQQVPAHIPDIVLNNLNDFIDQKGNILIPNEHTYHNSTLLFLDVSGFTNLTEKYSNDAHLGVDQLTRTLNSYFDKLVYEILRHNGDIYKFAGDAILAHWTDDKLGPQQALKCALHLQQKCGNYRTDVAVTLRLKVALAYGFVRAIFVGTDEFKHYLLTGDCVKNVNLCEKLCEPGQIILTKMFYDKVQTIELNCEFLPVNQDMDYFVVKYSLSRESSCASDESNDDDEHVSSLTSIEQRTDVPNQEITNHNHNQLTNDDFSERFQSLMRSFLLRCVYQRIDRKQPLYYLSELRRVTISFIKLDIANDETNIENISAMIQKVFLLIYEMTTMLGGVLTKALLFDKGWSFLCVFGLPGYKHGDDAANALKSAEMIDSAIKTQCQFVEHCSIGVATGLTYCGVVGHKQRCEYTVIGRKVNMAARLMCYYPNIISCDQETYYNSRLHSRFFQILPDKALKGMDNVGVIWHYDNSHEHSSQTNETQFPCQINDIQQENYPLLGRRVELMIVATQIMLLDEPTNSSNRRRDLAAIIFEGDDKIGRTRLLQFIADSLENLKNSNHISAISHYNNKYVPNDSTLTSNNTALPLIVVENQSSLNAYGNDCSMIRKSTMRIIDHRCQFEQRFNEFGLLRSLLRQLLQFHTSEQSQHEREQIILHLFDINQTHDLHLRRNLFLLNDLLDTRFRRNHVENENTNQTDLLKTYETNINELILHILNKLIDQPDNIGECYSPSSPAVLSNPINRLYSESRVSFGSASSLTSSSTIATVSKILFIIDDIHFADESSLKLLLTFGSHSKCLLILSMKPPRNNNNYDRSNSNILQSISTDSRVYLRRLPGLELRYLATLGCQILSVHQLPSKLIKVFNENCNGVPGFCEQILFDLLSKDKIHTVELNEQIDTTDQDLVEGDADKLLTNISGKNGLFRSFFSRQKQTISVEQRQTERAFSRICLLRNPSDDDFSADFQQNFQNYIMCRIDRLSEGESLLIKIAAVIGNTFSRSFLWHLVDIPSKKLLNMHSCILDMMQRTVIECAFSQQQPTRNRSIKCYCLQNPAGFPAQCRLMAFTHSSIREGIYNSLTDGLKRLLTRNAIDYLEKHCQIRCSTCRLSKYDSPFLVQHQNDLTKMIKARQQHALVDIVKMAALKEIDNTIKDLTKLSNSPVRTRSNTGKMLEESIFERKQSNSTKENLQSESTDDIQNEDKSEAMPSRETLSDPNLTLISVYPASESTNMQVNVQRSLSTASSSRPSQLFSLFKLPKHSHSESVASDADLLRPVDGFLAREQTKTRKPSVKGSKKNKTHRFLSFIRYFFCQFIPSGSNASVTPARIDPPAIEEPPVIEPQRISHWKKVQKAVLPSHGKIHRAMPNEAELHKQSMFSSEFIDNFANDFQCLNKQRSLIRAFQILYDRSSVFHTFQSYVQHHHFIQTFNETKSPLIDINESLSNFTSFNDLRICECADYVMTVYLKLVEYHTNLYDMYEKTTDDKHDLICSKQFDRIMYYRQEICQLLLRCQSYQRLLVEIDNARKFIEKFQTDLTNHEDFFYRYQILIVRYTCEYFQATVLQHSRAINEARDLCKQCLQELTQAYEDKIWEKLISADETIEINKHEDSSTVTTFDQSILLDGKYRLEYLLCQYYLLQYNLSRNQSVDCINKLLEFEYYTFPLSFSLTCTVQLVEYFYSQRKFSQCLSLIDKIIRFWWTSTDERQRLEFAKLKCLALIIELKQGSLDSAISCGYFAKRLFTGYHENIFLIECSIHLTLALIGEMRVSNIELILQHLEYLSRQTMNCYAKLWYYILVLDAAIELGFEMLPINADLLDNITKYRKKLHTESHESSLLLVYSDCVLAQVYARLGQFSMSKIHFHQALHQIKYDQMFLSTVDFRLKRSLTKLIEIQLLHWFHTSENEESISINQFLLTQFQSEDFIAWNRSRFFIYRAYYDRLINDYRRQANYTIDNDLNWERSLREAEQHAIKLDSEWIKRLRKVWLRPVAEQYSLQGKSLTSVESPRRSANQPKHSRRFVRLSVPQAKISTKLNEQSKESTIEDYSQQKFISCRLFLNNQNLSQFHLYILPVKI